MAGAWRARYFLFVGASLVIAAVGIFFAVRGPTDRPGEADVGASAPTALPPALSPPEREAIEEDHADRQAAGEDVHGHEEQPPPGLEQAGREFLRFYLRYEVGDASGSIEAGLRRTTTHEFAAELLQRAPRFPPGLGGTPVRARLLDVDAVPLVDDAGVARIVGKLRRGGDLEAVAFELQLSAGQWLISGVAG